MSLFHEPTAVVVLMLSTAGVLWALRRAERRLLDAARERSDAMALLDECVRKARLVQQQCQLVQEAHALHMYGAVSEARALMEQAVSLGDKLDA